MVNKYFNDFLTVLRMISSLSEEQLHPINLIENMFPQIKKLFSNLVKRKKGYNGRQVGEGEEKPASDAPAIEERCRHCILMCAWSSNTIFCRRPYSTAICNSGNTYLGPEFQKSRRHSRGRAAIHRKKGFKKDVKVSENSCLSIAKTSENELFFQLKRRALARRFS